MAWRKAWFDLPPSESIQPWPWLLDQTKARLVHEKLYSAYQAPAAGPTHWEAMQHSDGDYATAATAISVVFHENGYEKTYKLSDVRRSFEVYDGVGSTAVRDIYNAAGLIAEEISGMSKYTKDDNGEFLHSTAYDKLFNYFMDTNEMPYHVAKARTECPDEWILNKLGEYNARA